MYVQNTGVAPLICIDTHKIQTCLKTFGQSFTYLCCTNKKNYYSPPGTKSFNSHMQQALVGLIHWQQNNFSISNIFCTHSISNSLPLCLQYISNVYIQKNLLFMHFLYISCILYVPIREYVLSN